MGVGLDRVRSTGTQSWLKWVYNMNNFEKPGIEDLSQEPGARS